MKMGGYSFMRFVILPGIPVYQMLVWPLGSTKLGIVTFPWTSAMLPMDRNPVVGRSGSYHINLCSALSRGVPNIDLSILLGTSNDQESNSSFWGSINRHQ